MMTDAQSKAWDCLLDIEKQSLFLQLSEKKSSWEAGEILKVAHYKYIEIRERSQKFFKMFSEFFEKRTSIFRPDSPCDQSFKDYIEACIEHRLRKRNAVLNMGDSINLLIHVTLKNLTRNMERLKESEDDWDIDTRRLIWEFDRWNNFRILPKMLQQPSAFKRRTNKKDKIYIKYLLTRLPNNILEQLKERFYYKVKPGKEKYWVCLISKSLYTDGYYLLPVRPKEEVIKELSRKYIYVFKERDDADSFGFLISKYVYKTQTIKLGQKFWPEYRFIVKKAMNYNSVNNLEFSIDQLDMAHNITRKRVSRSKKVSKTGVERAESELFY